MKEKRKVGRPKLADNKLKKESIIVSSIISIMVVVIVLLASSILFRNVKFEDISGSVIRKNTDYCEVEDGSIICGPSVTKLTYKVDNNEEVEVSKDINSINVKVGNYNKLTYCYTSSDKSEVCYK